MINCRSSVDHAFTDGLARTLRTRRPRHSAPLRLSFFPSRVCACAPLLSLHLSRLYRVPQPSPTAESHSRVPQASPTARVQQRTCGRVGVLVCARGARLGGGARARGRPPACVGGRAASDRVWVRITGPRAVIISRRIGRPSPRGRVGKCADRVSKWSCSSRCCSRALRMLLRCNCSAPQCPPMRVCIASVGARGCACVIPSRLPL
jgi:hypothetical protein